MDHEANICQIRHETNIVRMDEGEIRNVHLDDWLVMKITENDI